jgi:mannose-6-phosphate isomerase-like protein (cupin superfamily)
VRLDPADFLRHIPAKSGERFTLVFEHGSLAVELYAPRGVDSQTPHTRDEVYVVIGGRGTFVCGDVRELFEPIDLLFAPAGAAHRFEDFTDDLLVWVLFYGPEGGEVPAS